MSTAIAAPCETAAATLAEPAPCPHGNVTLLASILASSLAFIDGSVVNVALPTIGREIHADAADLQWILNAYLLPVSALLLLGGAAGDAFGRRRVFLIGIGVFALASALCAAAPSLGLLLAGRALQGAGAAMLMPNSLALLGAAFDGPARGRAVGTWAAAGAVAGALGPLAGGWLTEAISWRVIFLINLPIAAGALWLGMRYVLESGDVASARLDWLGGLLATVGLGGITWALTALTGGGDNTGATTIVGSVGILALALFVTVEHLRSDRAMMPLALFGTSAFTGLTLLTFALYGALSGLLVLLPFVLIVGGGYSAVAAGAALLPLPAVIGIASRSAGQLSEHVGARLPLTLGPLIVAIGLALFALVEVTGSYWTTVLPAVLVLALGMAVAVAPLTTAVMAAVDPSHVGVANGFNSAVARTGGLVATAALGSVLAARGDALIAAFKAAAWVGAGAALFSCLSAWVMLGRNEGR